MLTTIITTTITPSMTTATATAVAAAKFDTNGKDNDTIVGTLTFSMLKNNF
jgi:hypothetical protein